MKSDPFRRRDGPSRLAAMESRLTVPANPLTPTLSHKGRGSDEGRTEQRINAVKRLAVSTGQLRRLLALHTQPIDLVVFQEPSPRRAGDLILGRVSRLDAFSVYPGRT